MQSVETRLAIEGMTCGACERRVGAALKSVAGVTEVKVDRGSACAIVQHDEAASAEALASAVDAAGYRARVATATV